jgi:hypothetical protein
LTHKGDSIQSHLSNTFQVMILHYPTNALEKLEEVSYLIRHGMELNDFLKIEEIRTYVELAVDEQLYIEAAQTLFPIKAKSSEEEED